MYKIDNSLHGLFNFRKKNAWILYINKVFTHYVTNVIPQNHTWISVYNQAFIWEKSIFKFDLNHSWWVLFYQAGGFHRDLGWGSMLLHVRGLCAAVLHVGGGAPTLAEGCLLHSVSLPSALTVTVSFWLFIT